MPTGITRHRLWLLFNFHSNPLRSYSSSSMEIARYFDVRLLSPRGSFMHPWSSPKTAKIVRNAMHHLLSEMSLGRNNFYHFELQCTRDSSLKNLHLSFLVTTMPPGDISTLHHKLHNALNYGVKVSLEILRLFLWAAIATEKAETSSSP